ncbi:MAG: hypothetical protein ACXABY_15075 [Candidatus Thorarchaeota archaeon]|jgi:hypothetical protein
MTVSIRKSVNTQDLFVCDGCGATHWMEVFELHGGGTNIDIHDVSVPYTVEGDDGKYCNLTCAIKAISRD